MEERRLAQPELTQNQLKRVVMIGLVLDSTLIIFSVDTLFRESRYIELSIATIVFILLLFIIRRLNRSG